MSTFLKSFSQLSFEDLFRSENRQKWWIAIRTLVIQPTHFFLWARKFKNSKTKFEIVNFELEKWRISVKPIFESGNSRVFLLNNPTKIFRVKFFELLWILLTYTSVCIKTRHQTSFCSETKIEFEKLSKKTIRFLISRNGRRPNRIERYSTTRKKGSIWNPFTRNGFYPFQSFS